jgi:Domain of Unknown Function with PDB structure (DUF3857)
MKKVNSLLLLIVVALQINAQTNIYSAFTIPDSLKKDADVVLREEYIKFTLKDINSAKHEVHKVYTILNEGGKELLNFTDFSSKFHVLDDAEIKVYDAFGIKKNTYSKKEMISLNYGEGLVPEGKVTYFNVTAPSYPITVEINYTVKYKGLLGYPAKNFQIPYQSVQQSVFEVEVPSDLSFRYKILNCNYQPVITKDGSKELYRWETKNLPATKVEKHSGPNENYIPRYCWHPINFNWMIMMAI